MFKRVLMFSLIFSLAIPVSGFCGENSVAANESATADPVTSKNENHPGLWFGASAGLILGGLLTLNSANDYESKYDDPRKYNQDDAKNKANTLRTVAYCEFGVAAVLALVGLNKLSVNKTTEVSLTTEGRTPMLMAKHTF